jgi:hypothetical protein
MFARISDLFSMLEIESRIPENVQPQKIFECDYSNAKTIIEGIKIESLNYFINAFAD